MRKGTRSEDRKVVNSSSPGHSSTPLRNQILSVPARPCEIKFPISDDAVYHAPRASSLHHGQGGRSHEPDTRGFHRWRRLPRDWRAAAPGRLRDRVAADQPVRRAGAPNLYDAAAWSRSRPRSRRSSGRTSDAAARAGHAPMAAASVLLDELQTVERCSTSGVIALSRASCRRRRDRGTPPRARSPIVRGGDLAEIEAPCAVVAVIFVVIVLRRGWIKPAVTQRDQLERMERDVERHHQYYSAVAARAGPSATVDTVCGTAYRRCEARCRRRNRRWANCPFAPLRHGRRRTARSSATSSRAAG